MITETLAREIILGFVVIEVCNEWSDLFLNVLESHGCSFDSRSINAVEEIIDNFAEDPLDAGVNVTSSFTEEACCNDMSDVVTMWSYFDSDSSEEERCENGSY